MIPDALGALIAKFLEPKSDLSPAGIDNHAMGTVFEESVRKFNEENNEEAGEHWTPRDAVKLMADLMFLPVAEKIPSGSYILYDECSKQIVTHVYGEETPPESYAICKADILLEGDG